MYTEKMIDLITLGLPIYIPDKIDREALQDTQDLNEISKQELIVEKNKNGKKGTAADSKFHKNE